MKLLEIQQSDVVLIGSRHRPPRFACVNSWAATRFLTSAWTSIATRLSRHC
jgi:hypothetical protein